jgi:hypothetical protein
MPREIQKLNVLARAMLMPVSPPGSVKNRRPNPSETESK